MTENLVKQEVLLSQELAPALAILKKCGRSDLAEKFLAQQQEVLSTCEATAEQIAKIKAPLSAEYNVKNCSTVEQLIGGVQSIIDSRIEWASNLAVIKKGTINVLTCDAEPM